MIKVNVKVPIGYNTNDVLSAVCAHIPVRSDEIRELVILRSSLDFSDG